RDTADVHRDVCFDCSLVRGSAFGDVACVECERFGFNTVKSSHKCHAVWRPLPTRLKSIMRANQSFVELFDIPFIMRLIGNVIFGTSQDKNPAHRAIDRALIAGAAPNPATSLETASMSKQAADIEHVGFQ